MPIKSLDDVLEDFALTDKSESDEYTTLTIWVPKAYKNKYKELQERTSKKFCKLLRKIVITTIDKAESKVS